MSDNGEDIHVRYRYGLLVARLNYRTIYHKRISEDTADGYMCHDDMIYHTRECFTWNIGVNDHATEPS